MRFSLLIPILLMLTGCSTFMPDRYHTAADNTVSLRRVTTKNIGVGQFSGPTEINTTCRFTRHIGLPDKLTFHGYIQHALEDELKVAGVYDAASPKVVLTGNVEALNYDLGLLHGGVWRARITFTSSNGKAVTVSEEYEIPITITDTDNAACMHTASAFLAVVQNLIGKLVNDPNFSNMISVE